MYKLHYGSTKELEQGVVTLVCIFVIVEDDTITM